ncbi:MAG: hypothetical protein J5I59_02885 [Saprospiraceae bacterium]|nr:hypothetical protein [Saprospiraceae bacterium]
MNPIVFGQGNANYDVVNMYIDDNNWKISFAELLSNDGNPNNQFVSVNNNCNYSYNFIGSLITPALDQVNQNFVITSPLASGIYHFCPDVLSGGVVLPQLVVVVVSQKSQMNLKDCCPDNCNLVCGGDFENYPMTEEEYGIPSLKIFNHSGTSKFKFNNLNGPASNFVMVSSDGTNRKLFFPDIFSYEGGENPQDVLYDWNKESGFVMPLREGIQPGKTVTISFQATMFANIHTNNDIVGKNGYIRLFGLNAAGTNSIPLTFQTSSGCTSCGNGFYVQSSIPATLTLTDCAFTCGCPDPNNVGVKNTDTYWSSLTPAQKDKDCMAVEGNLVMDQNVSLTGKQFIMQDNSTITINNNQISYYRCTINGCEYLWNGIRLNHDNAAICFTESVLKDAIEGIKREKRKAFIASYRSQFINNRIGISLPLYLVPPYIVEPNTPIIVEGNTFTSPSLLDHPILKTKNQIGFAGITGSTSNEVFGNVANAKGNTFTNIGNGIYLDDCYAVVNNSNFANIQPLSYYYLNNAYRSGFGISNSTVGSTLIVGGVANSNLPSSDNSFENVNVGIFANANLFANNTKMENVNTGINFVAGISSGLYSSNNYVYANRFGYDIATREESPFGVVDNNNIYTNPSSTYNSMYGMRANLSGYNNSEGFDMTVLNNTFSGTNKMKYGIYLNNVGHWNFNGNSITSSHLGFYGIYVSKGESDIILNNSIYAGGIAPDSKGIVLRSFNDSYLQCNLTEGTAIGIEIYSPNVGSEFITNEMKSNSSKGLYMGSSATYTSAFNGGVHYLAGNLWTGSQNSVPAIHYGIASQITNSRFRTNNSNLPIFPVGFSTPNYFGVDPWFAPGVIGNDKVGDCNIPEGGGSTDWLIPYATDSITYAQYDTSLNSTGKHIVYEYMKKNPGLTYSPTLTNFYATYGASDPGKIDDIRIQVRQAIMMPQASRTAIINYRNQIIAAMGDISALQSNLSSAECAGDLPYYKAQSQVLTQQIIDWHAQIKAITNTYKTNRNNTLANLLQQLALIPDPTDAPSYYEKVEVHKEIDYFISGSDQLGIGAMTDLINIATLCPDYGGSAVYRARAFITVEQPTLMWDDSNCESVGNLSGDQIEQRSVEDTKVGEYRCYPNPSTGQFTIVAPLSFDGYVKVVDSYGNPIIYRKYADPMALDLKLNHGMYYILFLSQDQEVKKTEKILIIK